MIIADSRIVGGFARAVDLIQSEYKWTDDVVLDIPLRRARQINEVIRERRSLDDFHKRAYIEWQTKSLAQFFSVAAQSSEAADSVLEAASALSLLYPKAKKNGTKGGKDAPPTLDHLPPDDSPNAERNAAINKEREKGGGGAGSFERMAGMFGSGGVMRGGPG